MRFFSILLLIVSIFSLELYASTSEIERIVINSKKLPIYLNETPASVTVISQDKLNQQDMVQLEDVARYVPSIHVGEAGLGTNLFIRGIGSGVNYGFEQSVGLFIDGVYYGRGRHARSGFLDVTQVEVYKGPQSTLFGKNTIAGTINITSAMPTKKFSSSLAYSYETELKETILTSITSGSLSDNIQGRLALRISESDGYINNTFLNDSEPKNENRQIRLNLLWQASNALDVSFIAETQSYDTQGRNDMITIASPTANYFYQTFGDDNFTAEKNYTKSQQTITGPSYRQINRSKQYDNTDSHRVQVAANYQTSNHLLRSITAWHGYNFIYYLGGDYSPLQLLAQGRIEKHEQISQELILSSINNEKISYDLGFYYQKNDLNTDRVLDLQLSNLPPAESILYNLLGFPSTTPPGMLDMTSTWQFEQTTKSYSAFANIDFQLNEKITTQIGIRFTDEEKYILKSQYSGKLFMDEADPFLSYIYSSDVLNIMNSIVFNKDTPNFNPTRKEQHWSAHIGIQYQLSNVDFLYGNISNGSKSGGFDENNALASVENAIFEDEKVIAYELGLKSSFWQQQGQLNLAIFRSDFEDLQVSSFDGNCCFIVGNAATAITQGVELELALSLTDDLSISTAIVYLDATYDSFIDAVCNDAQLSMTPTGQPCRQDLSGKTLQFSPKWSINASARYQFAISSRLRLTTYLDINASDKYAIANDLDLNLFQNGFYKVNGGISLTPVSNIWSLSLLAKNMTNETTFSWGNDVPLGGLGFSGSYFQHIDPPRTFTLQGMYSF